MGRPRPLFLSKDQLIAASYDADKLGQTLHRVSAIDALSPNPDILFYRDVYQRELRLHLENLAKDCGYRLVPISAEIHSIHEAVK